MKLKANLKLALVVGLLLLYSHNAHAQYLMENLGRGVVAIRQNATDVYVGWRQLGTDSSDVSFNLYRSTGGGPEVLLNPSPITDSTNFVDTTADLSQANAYSVRPVVGGVEGAPSAAFTLPADAAVQQYLNVPLQIPPGGTTPDGSYTYTANDASVGDVDGDGEYEIILKWDPTNSKDNSQSGYTGNVYLDAYKMDGTRLWRIDLGRNIRAGAHYTQFMVYDLDGDGKAEVACKTADATVDGLGTVIGNANADYRNSSGYVLTGPEYLTVFNGQTGAAMATVGYNPPRGTVSSWGDDYGNRVDRFLAGVAYLDGRRPSLVMARGYYTRAYVAAYDFRDGQLTNRWNFDTGFSGGPYATWRGQGAHSLTIGDVDGDGRDEITYGAAAIDDDGSGLYSTLLGHGDALHMSDMDPTRPGQEVWMAHEDPGSYGSNGSEFRDAKTGALIFGVPGNGADVGRAVAGDIDPRYLGYEMWASRGGLNATNGVQITPSRPGQMNFMVWWDGDLLRELLDGTTISKWNWNTNTVSPVLAPAGLSSNNSTKANPALSADVLGDWREEVIWRTADNTALRIYTTTAPASNRIYTLMHDRQYRVAIAWQNTAYNQPPHPSFYIGEGMSAPPQPNIVTALADLPAVAPAVNSINRFDPFGQNTGATSVTFRVTFNTAVTGVNAPDFALTTTGSVTGTVSSVSPVSGLAYNVTVSSITGTGLIRLDLKSSGTGIASTGGVPVSGGFTSGQTYNRATLAWINAVTGGLWSVEGNWDGGVIADGVNSIPIFGNFDLTANNTVILDSPRTLSGLTFGDLNPASPASWVISDGGNPDNFLTLDTTSGAPAVAVNQLGPGATATIDAVIAGNKGLAKSGPGTLLLSKENSVTGQLSVGGGILRLTPGGALNTGSGTVNLTGSSQLGVAGGALTVGGLVTAGTGTLVVEGGSAALGGGFRTNSDFGSTLRVTGGTLTTPDVNIRRNGGATNDFTSGFIVANVGVANVGTVWLGNNNSTGAMSVEGGTLTATGAVTIGNNSGSGRGGGMRVLGGQFTSTDTASGVILTRASGNVTTANFTGGVSTVEKFTFGFNSSVTSGSGTLTLDGGTLYVGAGGLVRNATGSYASTINLSSGTLGAKANWSSALPMALGGNINLRAADAAGAPFNITLGGALTNATVNNAPVTGGFTKTGGGTLTLAGANTYTGATNVQQGTLRVDGSLSSGGGAVSVNGGTLAGAGAVNRAVTLGSGGTVSPGVSSAATLSAGSLAWNGGGKLAFDLGAASDRLALSGALTKGGAGTYEFAFSPGAGLADGTTYTLVTFSSTNFTAADFSHSGLPEGVKGFFTVNAGSLQFTVDGTAPTISCPEDITTGAAAGASSAVVNYTVTANDASGATVTGSPASGSAFPVGTTPVNVTAEDAAGNTSTCSFTVTVRSQPVVTVAPTSAQYSDAVTLQANVTATAFPGQPLAGTVQFFVNGSPVGQSALADGVATLAFTANMAAGSYDVTAQFTSANTYYLDAASAASQHTVSRENAAAAYTGDAALMTAGPNVNSATVRLAARLTPESDGAGFAGDLTKATVTFELFKSSNNSTTPDLVVAGVAVDANGDALATVQGVPAETYVVNVEVDAGNQFWVANPPGLGVLNIAVPSDEQRSGGGGWVADASSANGRASFGFTVTAGNKEGQVRGNWTVTFLGADGFYYVAKANSWQDGHLQFAAEPGTSPAVYTRSEMTGRCNVQKIDPATGLVVASFGNYTFEAHSFDGDLLNPKQADAYAFTVRDGAGGVWHQVGSRNSLVTLGGGNITNKAR
jgi:rhamnogalacturonan endolyase